MKTRKIIKNTWYIYCKLFHTLHFLFKCLKHFWVLYSWQSPIQSYSQVDICFKLQNVCLLPWEHFTLPPGVRPDVTILHVFLFCHWQLSSFMFHSVIPHFFSLNIHLSTFNHISREEIFFNKMLNQQPIYQSVSR